ncbi:DUF2283 domain-containing protein [Methanolobus sp. WCC5]|jgi:uncharacterized protein YuzE|uniref:DUF2283 domain-containing protein n=1 Tax=Methanolobus sp. WCC5 TaxID=3125785 RepID=UPI003251EF9E
MSKNKGIKKDDVFDYDTFNDSLFIHTSGMKYKHSIDFGDIILDIGEDNSITGLEVLSASRVFGITKYDVRNIKNMEATLKVSPESINLEVHAHISKRNSKISRIAMASDANYTDLPVGSESMAVSA